MRDSSIDTRDMPPGGTLSHNSSRKLHLVAAEQCSDRRECLLRQASQLFIRCRKLRARTIATSIVDVVRSVSIAHAYLFSISTYLNLNFNFLPRSRMRIQGATCCRISSSRAGEHNASSMVSRHPSPAS